MILSTPRVAPLNITSQKLQNIRQQLHNKKEYKHSAGEQENGGTEAASAILKSLLSNRKILVSFYYVQE